MYMFLLLFRDIYVCTHIHTHRCQWSPKISDPKAEVIDGYELPDLGAGND